MALEFFTQAYEAGKQSVQEALTPDPDFTHDEIKERQGIRKKITSSLNTILNTPIGQDVDGSSILIRNLPKDHKYWSTEDGELAKKRLKSYRKALKGKYETTYQELQYEPVWIDSLQKIHKAEMGSEWQGSNFALTEEYFERYNDFANSLTKTTYEGLTDSFWFSDFNEEQLNLVAQTYDTFHKTDMTGLGSRPLYEQSKDFIMQSGSDPTTLASIYFTGGLAKLGTTAIAPLVMKKLVADQIAKRALLAASMITSSGLGANISANLQVVQQRMEGVEDLDIDEGEVATVAAVSSLIPPFLSGVSKVASKVTPFIDDLIDLPRQMFRFLGSPAKTIWKDTARGRGAAGFGMLEAEEKAIIRGSTDTSTVDLSTQLIDDVVNPGTKAISDGFASLKYKDMPVAAQQQLRNIFAAFKVKNSNLEAGVYTKNLDAILSRMFHEADLDKFIIANKLANKPFEEWPTKILGGLRSKVSAQTWMDLRNEIYDIAQKQFTSTDGNKQVGNAFMKLYGDVKGVQQLSLANPGEVQLWNSLNKANTQFQSMLDGSPVGQYFARIKKFQDDAKRFTKNGDPHNTRIQMLNAEDESKELLEYLLHNKNAYTNLLKFKEGLNLVDQTSKNVQKAINNSTATDLKINAQRAEKNIAPLTVRDIIDKPATTDSYNQMMVIVKNELGNYLDQQAIQAAKVEGVAYAALDELISRPNGLKLITEIFPEQRAFYTGLQKLKQVLMDTVAKKSGQSVIINMTVARMAADLGTSAGGKFGGFAAPVATVPLLQRMRNTVGNARWQKAMADTINNNGQIPTWFSKFLKKTTGWSDKDISALQRDWSIIIYGTAVPKFDESIKESQKDIQAQRETPWSGWSLTDMYGKTTGDLKSMSMFSP